MMFRSIRWQLSLSYAAIALLAAFALGVVLVSILRSYYDQREVAYLQANARAIGQFVMEGDAANLALQAQVQTLAFLAQARVRLFDRDGAVWADTGHPGNAQYFSLGSLPSPAAASDVFTRPVVGPKPLVILRTAPGGKSTALPPGVNARTLILKSNKVLTGSVTMDTLALYSFGLGDEAAGDGGRSSQVIRQELLDAAGRPAGSVELSEGPAYGRQIVESVGRGWALASVVAVLLATAAGWLASRRISAPLQALAGATERMAAGDLAARAAAGPHAPAELVRLAQSFNQMAGQVEETVLALRRFVSDAAHELRTPLTALRTNLELAAGETDNAALPPGHAALQQAEAQVRRLDELTQNLLELSRLEAGPAGETRRPVDLVALVRAAAEPAASQAEQAGLTFALDLSPAEVVVAGDEGRLCSLLTNLLDNAVKFTPSGGAVTLSLRSEGPWAVLEVADTGIGIPGGDLPQLFSRFHRGRNTAGYPGNGLGLAIVEAIVDGYGGSVDAQNADPGARFVVRLPLSPAD